MHMQAVDCEGAYKCEQMLDRGGAHIQYSHTKLKLPTYSDPPVCLPAEGDIACDCTYTNVKITSVRRLPLPSRGPRLPRCYTIQYIIAVPTYRNTNTESTIRRLPLALACTATMPRCHDVTMPHNATMPHSPL